MTDTYDLTNPDKPLIFKDPNAVLDYSWDWFNAASGEANGWLNGDTYSSHTITADAGITVNSSSQSGGIITAWLAGGTVGVKYKVTCRIVTTGGRTDDRTIYIKIKER